MVSDGTNVVEPYGMWQSWTCAVTASATGPTGVTQHGIVVYTGRQPGDSQGAVTAPSPPQWDVLAFSLPVNMASVYARASALPLGFASKDDTDALLAFPSRQAPSITPGALSCNRVGTCHWGRQNLLVSGHLSPPKPVTTTPHEGAPRGPQHVRRNVRRLHHHQWRPGHPGAVLTLWTARTGGTQITDLLDVDSVACTTVTSAADGSVVYYGPNNDKTVHWADSVRGRGWRYGPPTSPATRRFHRHGRHGHGGGVADRRRRRGRRC